MMIFDYGSFFVVDDMVGLALGENNDGELG
jgi:hypothetical protein